MTQQKKGGRSLGITPRKPRKQRSRSRLRKHQKKEKRRKGKSSEIPHFSWKAGLELGREGRYVVEQALGDGTFGRVLECVDQKTQMKVAVKVVKGVQNFREHAESEAEVLAQILRKDENQCRRCVALYDAFLHDSQNFCIVFEPLDVSLRDFLKANSSRGLLLADAVEVTRQLLEGVGFLHNIGVVHTDLKCRNVMLRYGDFDIVPHPRADGASTRMIRNVDVVIIDFGSAVFPDDPHDGRIGTRQFRAPEVVLGLDWDDTSDIWSVGCIATMLYRGTRPFSVHEDMEHLAMMEKVAGGPVPPRLLLDAQSRKTLPEGVAIDENGRLLWPTHAPDERAVESVEDLDPLRDMILDRHSAFRTLCAGMLDVDPSTRLRAVSASKSEVFLFEDVTE